MNKYFLVLLTVALFTCSLLAGSSLQANENIQPDAQTALDALAKVQPSIHVTSIGSSPVPGLFELVSGG